MQVPPRREATELERGNQPPDHALRPAADRGTQQFLAYRDRGDVIALEVALLEATPALRRVAHGLVPAADVDDLIQDCFVVAISAAQRFDPHGRLAPWLLGILHNVARSKHRQRWRRLARTDDHEARAAAFPAAADADAQIDLRAWFADFGQALGNLGEPYRSVVGDHLLKGEPLASIAARTQRPAATVRSQFARGLRELRRRLPTPLLAGLVGLLAGRSATAARPWLVPPARRGLAAALAVSAGIVTSWGLWSWLARGPDAGPAVAPTSPPTVAVAAAPAPRDASPATPATPQRQAAPTVRVRLQHADGTPAKGVAVAFEPQHILGANLWRVAPTWRMATADADGMVHFGVDRQGPATIRWIDSPYLHRFEVGAEPVELAFTVPALRSLRVRAFDDLDRPIAGAAIFISSEKGMRAPGLHAATTGVDGWATITPAVPRYHLWAIADGHTGTISYSVSSESATTGPAPADADRALELRMPRSTQCCRGTVMTKSGHPLANATVTVWNEGNNVVPPRLLTTDRDGRFAYVGLDAATWAASAVADGYAAVSVRKVGGADEAVLQLVEGGALVGRLDLSTVANPTQLRVLARRESIGMEPLAQGAATVEPDGTFRLNGLTPGTYHVALQEGGKIHPQTTHATVENGLATAVTLAVHRSPRWQIRVEDDRGRPLANSLIRIHHTKFLAGPVADQEACTDQMGVAQLLPSEPEPVEILVHLPDEQGHDELPAAIRPGVAGASTVITLPAQQLEPARLFAQLPSTWLDEGFVKHLEIETAGRTRIFMPAAGVVFATDLPAGSFHLNAFCELDGTRWRWPLARFEAVAGNAVDLGQLSCDQLGTAEIALRSASGSLGPLVTLDSDANGGLAYFQPRRGSPARFRLPRGNYSLSFVDADLQTQRRSFAVKGNDTTRVDVEPGPGRSCRVEVRLREPRWQLGRFRATLRRTDSGAEAWLVFDPDGGQTGWTTEKELTPGAYTLECRVGNQSLRETLIVHPGTDRQVFPCVLL